MHDMRDDFLRDTLTFCCNVFLTDGKETDAMNYVSVLEKINGIIKGMGLSNAASADIIVNSDEICLRMNICGDNYLLAIIKINNSKIIFKDVLEDDFYDAVSVLIHKYHLLESHK